MNPVWIFNGLISKECHSRIHFNHKLPDNQLNIAFEPNNNVQRKPHATLIFIAFNC